MKYQRNKRGEAEWIDVSRFGFAFLGSVISGFGHSQARSLPYRVIPRFDLQIKLKYNCFYFFKSCKKIIFDDIKIYLEICIYFNVFHELLTELQHQMVLFLPKLPDLKVFEFVTNSIG